MSYQLIRRDEYGSADIIGSFNDLPSLVTAARKQVTTDNIENALTFDDKMNDWETFWVEILDDNGNPSMDAMFGGFERGSKFVYHFHDGVAEKKYLDEISVPMRFFVGNDNKKPVYASRVVRGKPGERANITDLNDQALRDKGYYYVKVL